MTFPYPHVHPIPRSMHPVEGAVSDAPALPLTADRVWLCHPEDATVVQRFVAAADVPLRLATRDGARRYGLSTQDNPLPLDPPARGYALLHDSAGVNVQAADLPGFYAAMQSLWQLLDAPCDEPWQPTRWRDWPATARRAFQIDLGRQPESAVELRRLIRQQARYHYNECQLYLENSLKLSAFESAADPDGLTVEELVALQQFGADLGVDVVPSMNLLGHMEKLLTQPQFAGLSEMAHGARHAEQPFRGCLCPELPESRELVAELLDELCAASLSARVMVGLDECWTLGSHPQTRARLDASGNAGPAFRDWICFLHEQVTRHNKQMWMWEDMLFYHLGALGHIPSDIGMNAWHYQHIESVPAYSFQNWRRIDSLAELTRHGHPVMLCCEDRHAQLASMFRYAEGRPLDGILVVQWEGQGVVQELYHVKRAAAAGVLWWGKATSPASAVQGVTGCDAARAEAIAERMAYREMLRPARRGGSHTCPRFWSWPDDAAALPVAGGLQKAWTTLAAGHEPLEVMGLFLDRELVERAADWARENAALVGRQMLQHDLTESSVLDATVEHLAQVEALAQTLPERAQSVHDRYTAGVTERRMPAQFARSAAATADLLTRLRRFQAAPGPETWPFARISLHLDGLVLDPCAHRVALSVSDEKGTWHSVYAGPAQMPPTLGGEFVMSFPLDHQPHQVRLAIGGFASLGIMRIRMETLEGTRLPTRLLDSGGYCRNPEHLLVFDRKVAVFSPPDVMSNWLSLEPQPEHYVVLAFEGA